MHASYFSRSCKPCVSVFAFTQILDQRAITRISKATGAALHSLHAKLMMMVRINFYFGLVQVRRPNLMSPLLNPLSIRNMA